MEVRPNLHITVTVTETVWVTESVTGSVTGSVRVTGPRDASYRSHGDADSLTQPLTPLVRSSTEITLK